MPGDTRTLQWPEGRGSFVDRTPERADAVSGTDGRGKFVAPPGTVLEVSDPDIADHYLDRGWVVADDDAEPGQPEPDDAEPMSWEDFQGMDYTDRVAAVDAGDVDHLLDQAAAEDDSTNVQDAVDQRQDEVED